MTSIRWSCQLPSPLHRACALQFITAPSILEVSVIHWPTLLFYITCLACVGIWVCNPTTGTSKNLSTTVFAPIILIQCLSLQLGCKLYKNRDYVTPHLFQYHQCLPPCLAFKYLLSEWLNINKLVLLVVL